MRLGRRGRGWRRAAVTAALDTPREIAHLCAPDRHMEVTENADEYHAMVVVHVSANATWCQL